MTLPYIGPVINGAINYNLKSSNRTSREVRFSFWGFRKTHYKNFEKSKICLDKLGSGNYNID